MIINDNSKIIQFDATKTNENDFYLPDRFNSEKRKITKINGTPYYFKKVCPKYMINELIGTIFSRILEIESANYEIGIYNKDFYALSKVFFKPEYDYSYVWDYYGTISYDLLSKKELETSKYYLKQIKMLKKIKNIEMLSQILKLTALDLKTGQVDRNNHNVMLKISKDTEIVDLAPLYDFSESYEEELTSSELKYYDNPFVVLRKNYLSLYHFAKNYPEFITYVKKLIDTPIYDVLTEIEKEFDIIFTDHEKEYYEERDASYTNLLKRII